MRSERATLRAEGTSCESTNCSVERIVIHSNPQRHCTVPAHWIFLARQPYAPAEACTSIQLLPSRVHLATYAQPIASPPSQMLKAAVGAELIFSAAEPSFGALRWTKRWMDAEHHATTHWMPCGQSTRSNPRMLHCPWNIHAAVAPRRLHAARFPTRSP